MQIVSEELRALVAAMAVEDREVTHRHLRVQFQVLNALVRVFHTLTLANVADDAGVKSLHLELESANAERVIWLQDKLFVGLETAVNAARLEAVDADVLDQQGAERRVVQHLEVVLNDALTVQGHILTVGSTQ